MQSVLERQVLDQKKENVDLTQSKALRLSLFFLMLIGVFLITGYKQVEGDTLWHIKTGEWIVTNWSIPTTDIYSWTALGNQWHAHEWLWEVLAWWMYQVAGKYGVWAITCIGALLFSGSLFYITRRSGWIGFTWVVVAILFISSNIWDARPHSLAQGLWALWLLILIEKIGRKRIIVFLISFVLSAFWVNVHASAGIAFIFPILFGIFWKEERSRYFWATIGSLAGTVLNPWGPEIFLYTFFASGTPAIINSIMEWHSPNFHYKLILFVFLLSAFIIAFAGMRSKEKKVLRKAAPSLILATTFLAMTLISVRHFPYYLFLSAWAGSDLLGELSQWIRTKKYIRYLPFVIALDFAMIIFVAGINIGLPTWTELPRENYRFPEKAVDFIEKHGFTEKILNYYSWGGYLISRGIPVFIDGRADMYVLSGSSAFEDYSSFMGNKNDTEQKNDPPWEIVQKWGVKTILIPKDSYARFAMETKGWNVVYEDEQAVVMRKERG